MFEKFGEFDSAEEINRAAEAQKREGDTEACLLYTSIIGAFPVRMVMCRSSMMVMVFACAPVIMSTV